MFRETLIVIERRDRFYAPSNPMERRRVFAGDRDPKRFTGSKASNQAIIHGMRTGLQRLFLELFRVL